MAITNAWTAPTDNEIDLDNGDLIGEATFDKIGSDLWWLYNRHRQLGKGTATTNQAISSTASPGTDITGLTSGSVTPDGVHDVEITWSLPGTNTSAAVTTYVALQKDGVVICVWVLNIVEQSWTGTYIDPVPTAAGHVYKLSAWVSSAATFNTINQLHVPSVIQNLIVVRQTG